MPYVCAGYLSLGGRQFAFGEPVPQVDSLLPHIREALQRDKRIRKVSDEEYAAAGEAVLAAQQKRADDEKRRARARAEVALAAAVAAVHSAEAALDKAKILAAVASADLDKFSENDGAPTDRLSPAPARAEEAPAAGTSPPPERVASTQRRNKGRKGNRRG